MFSFSKNKNKFLNQWYYVYLRRLPSQHGDVSVMKSLLFSSLIVYFNYLFIVFIIFLKINQKMQCHLHEKIFEKM